MDTTKKEIILGSAFCPPTIGHHAIIQALRQIPDIDMIRLVPSGIRGDKSYTLSNDIRRKLVEVFASEFDDPRVVADFTFLDSTQPTTTLGMDRYYRAQRGISPVQVFGADVVTAMASWPNTPEDSEYLLQRMPKIFLKRHGVELRTEGR